MQVVKAPELVFATFLTFRRASIAVIVAEVIAEILASAAISSTAINPLIIFLLISYKFK